jgi:fatty acid desaturase
MTSSTIQKVGALRPAVLTDAKGLSVDARKEIMGLSGARPGRFTSQLALTWVTIFALIAAAVVAHNWLVSLLCVFLIGTRQMVLALLMHEQVHRLGMRSKYADWLVNMFAVFPLFVTTVEDYAKVHLSHHKYCFTKDDPDFLRKSGPEWTYPMSKRQLFGIAVRDLLGMNVLKLIRGKKAHATTEFTRRHPTPKWMRISFYLALAAVLSLVGGWMVFMLYWALPLMTITQLLVRWLAVCEHEYNIENGEIHETTPLIKLNWWQHIIFPDLNFGLHVYHHMHPGVSFGNLPKVHEIYKREGFVDESAVFHGQGSYLKYITTPK